MKKLVAVITIIVAFGEICHATLITYQLDGVVTRVNIRNTHGVFTRPFYVGELMHCVIRFDTSTGQSDGHGSITYQASAAFGLGNSGGVFSDAHGYAGLFSILNDSAKHNFGLSFFSGYQADPFEGTDGWAGFHLFRHGNGAKWNQNVFRAVSLGLLGFEPHGAEFAFGKITSVTTHVPDPGSTFLLFGIGLAPLLAHRIFRR